MRGPSQPSQTATTPVFYLLQGRTCVSASIQRRAAALQETVPFSFFNGCSMVERQMGRLSTPPGQSAGRPGEHFPPPGARLNQELLALLTKIR